MSIGFWVIDIGRVQFHFSFLPYVGYVTIAMVRALSLALISVVLLARI